MERTELKLFTIGAYGSTADEFFARLREHDIPVLVDIRWRRGMRGAEYAWANKSRLETRCAEEDIVCWPVQRVAPPPELRAVQYAADKQGKVAKRQRSTLSAEFCHAYEQRILATVDLDDVVHEIRDLAPHLHDPVKVCFFCVEKEAEACHRSLLADALAARYGWPVTHL
ncbi:DUF488 domain-containing protein [bacterium]|nr:DUF488 domain-containing protein [bacterium]